ncbi:MAG: hypothetical protein HY674_05500 [Chloroflexi bacterium]|nr:hypothetical protein [Chloroflexota bacterium]
MGITQPKGRVPLLSYPLLWGVLQFILASTAGLGYAQSAPVVDMVVDLLETFNPALVREASECAVQRPATVGGAKQDALFKHPKSVQNPARAEFRLDLPQIAADERLFLAFDIGLRDGVKFDRGADGVRFVVECDGKQVFARDHRECRWQSYAVDLTLWGGRPLPLALLTDAIGNTSYDWAVWGSPRVLRFRSGGSGALKPNAPGFASFPIATGALAFKLPPGQEVKLRLKPDAGGAGLEWDSPAAPSTGQPELWLVKDFNFPGATRVEIEWEPKEGSAAPPAREGATRVEAKSESKAAGSAAPPAREGADILVAAYAAQPKLLKVSPGQALISAGDHLPLLVEVRNQGRGQSAEGEFQVELQAGEQILPARSLPALEPGASRRLQWDWKAPERAGRYPLKARLLHPQSSDEQSGIVEVFPALQAKDTASVQNEQLKLEFGRASEGFAYAKVFARQDSTWKPVAIWRPLFRIVAETQAGEKDWEIRPRELQQLNRSPAGQAGTIAFQETARDADGVVWETTLRITLEPQQPFARLHYEWKAGQDRKVKALWGPNLYAGDGAIGEAKSWGLFPGLEYLYGAERSSNPRDFSPPLADRRTPHPHKITIPLMAVTLGPHSQKPPENPARFFAPDSLKDRPLLSDLKSQPDRQAGQISNLKSEVTVALLWDGTQRWDGEHAFPSTRFASPNFDEGMQNHRLGLFLPSAPDFVPENGDRASQPYLLPAGKTLTLDARLLVAPGPATVAVLEWLRETGGLPKANPWPRSFQEELDVCRAGFLKTVWDAASEKWRHCIGWAPSHAPGFAALLWWDGQIAESPADRRQSRERVELAVKNMLRDSGPGMFTSQANCHIMQWEFPFLYGYLPEAMAGLENHVRHLIESQQPEGGWLYQPGNEQQADLGQAGDSVLGTCANRAALLLRYARITGDAAALAAGEKALRFMGQFRVPRGGQTWECPMYEPDILAAAYAIRAYHDAFRATGDARWLHDAVYWAETGVPFLYLWTLPERPMMLGATIPVFGSTFYTHTWLAVPVQWCGLVYAYHVFHLAQELERRPLSRTDSPLPLALGFSPADWKRVVELITVSGLHQQFAEGDRIGSYPDSIVRFEQRNPAFINPEDILVNMLALQGYDADVKTERLKSDRGEIVISSGANIKNVQATDAGMRFELASFPGEPSHSLVAGLKPREIVVNGKRLAPSASPVRREPGWWWDAERRRAYLAVAHEKREVQIEMIRE